MLAIVACRALDVLKSVQGGGEGRFNADKFRLLLCLSELIAQFPYLPGWLHETYYCTRSKMAACPVYRLVGHQETLY